MGRTRDEVSEQVSVQQRRLVGSLRTVGQELAAMSEGGRRRGLQSMADDQEPPTGSGIASELSYQLADFVTRSADWLDGRQPADVLDELRAVARRKPGTFLAVAGLTGLLAGRLTRGAVSSNGSAGTSASGGSSAGDLAGTSSPDSSRADVFGSEGSSTGVYAHTVESYDTPASGVPTGVSQPERTTFDDELFGRGTELRR
jgi:hypothetical protein